MTAEFQVFLPRPLSSSDNLEHELAVGLRKRMNLLQSIRSGIPLQSKYRYLGISRVLRSLILLASSRFPHGSDRRKKLRELNAKLPRVIRNRIFTVLAPQFDTNSTQAIAYSLDLGFALPTSPNPLITVVIPVHNNWWVTYRCLRTLQSNSDKTPFEVVVVDDASTDQTQEALENLRGITVVRNLTNIGYLLSTNRGTSLASSSSKYLVLLNNDTEPLDGWLDNLFKTIENDSSIAIVGSALISPDGTVQEVGAQIFKNGAALNLGRGKNMTNQIFNFTREVDYCSAAAIMVRRTFWLDANGFDERYAPAYCEDSDLALTAWKKNMKVVFEPKSWVIHHEGLSHGTSVLSGIKKHQVINTRKLFGKWEVELREHWKDSGLPRFEATRSSKGIVVVCDRQLPAVTRDAGSVRTFQIIRHIQSLGFHVVLVAIDGNTTEIDLDNLRSSGVEVHVNLDDFYQSLTMRRERIRAAWIMRQEVYEAFFPRIKSIAPHSNFIADFIDVRYKKEYSPRSGISNGQLKIADTVQRVVFCSESEAREYNDQTQQDKAVGLWAEYEPQKINIEWGSASGLIFVGGFRHFPNLEGMQWFANQVAPELKRLGFKAPIRIVGSGLTTMQKAEFESQGLEVMGLQLDIVNVYSQSRIAIIPLLHGAGRKGKVGEALSFGIPIVSTSVGVQGFDNLQTTGITVSDSPIEMARSIYELHERFDLWSKASNLGTSYCNSHLSSVAMRDSISKLISLGLIYDA